MEDINASANSLANYALRDVLQASSLASRVIDSPRVRHANLMAKPSIILVNSKRRTFAILYAVKGRSLQLFREQTLNARTLRESWRDYARGFVTFEVDRAGNVEIHAAGFTVRAARELLRPYIQPLSSGEIAVLVDLLRALRDSRHAA